MSRKLLLDVFFQGLEIKILRSSKSGIPCLRNVDIFGVASAGVESSEVETTASIWESMSAKSASSRNPLVLDGLKVKDPDQDCLQLRHAVAAGAGVPEDFLDALTHERMDVPMVLPCGQVRLQGFLVLDRGRMLYP